MEQDLDKILKQRIERFYRRLVNAYENRMKVANDKAYSHEQFEKWAKAGVTIRKECDESYNAIINIMNGAYRLGNPIANAIKTLREMPIYNTPSSVKQVENLDNTKKDKPSDLVSPLLDLSLLDESIACKNEAKPVPVKESKEKEQPKPEWNKLSDLELVCLFADQVTKERFLEYINSQAEKPDSNVEVTETPPGEPSLHKNKEFTTARQVVAIHFMLKYMQVKNIDKTEIAKFIQFLTGKNYDNIYKRLLRMYSIKEKVLKEDLRYVRDYFERMELKELVKMINNEIDSGI